MKIINPGYIEELQNEYENYSFERIRIENGMYITSEIIRSVDNDPKIFSETQVKRILRGNLTPFMSQTVKDKLAYFYQKENLLEENIYKYDKIQSLQSGEEYAIHNIGHATQLIQIAGFNILTDPVFYDLNKMLYPAITNSYPDIKDLPEIHIIIISHNHLDHVDKNSLQKILENHTKNGWPHPQVFVPKGDKELLVSFGFKDVEEVEWYTKINIRKNFDGMEKDISFISIPSDHRSGRNMITDHHKSLVTGWIVNPVNENVIFKFSGDTRSLATKNQKAVDAVIWHEIKNKTNNKDKSNEDIEIPDIICFEPSGPTYTRVYMDVTHQSATYSILLKLVEADNLAGISGLKPQIFLTKLKTLMMHHNKFEFGPDRFNEGLFLFKKLMNYIDMSDEDLNDELVRQCNKCEQNADWIKLKNSVPFTSRLTLALLPEHTSILIHAKDFIIDEMKQMINKDIHTEIIKECLVNNTVFAKIGERLNNKEIADNKLDIESIKKYNGSKK